MKFFLKEVLGFIKKTFLVVATFFFVICLFLYFINKDRPIVDKNLIPKTRNEIYKIINDPQLNSSQPGKIIIFVYRSFNCSLIGEACTNNPKDGDKKYQQSVVGTMSKLISLPYTNPPASGIYWAYSSLQKAGLIPKTYAAEGLGFASIKPLMNIWKLFRDIAYMLLVLVLITIGFMVMFRTKINPQTVITVENALPKIVISLILITFSFPIAGLLIDIMYVVIILSISMLSSRGNYFDPLVMMNQYLGHDVSSSLLGMWPTMASAPLGKLSESLLRIIPFEVGQLIRIALGIGGTLLTHRIYTDVLKDQPEALANMTKGFNLAAVFSAAAEIPGVGGFISFMLKPILWIVMILLGFTLGYSLLAPVITILIWFSVIFLLFRILALVFSTYIKIILFIIFSPLFLLFEAIPSGKSAFSYWFKSLVSEILTFPIIIVLLIVSYLMVNTSVVNTQKLWAPPFLSYFDAEALSVVISMGIFFMIPDLVKLSKKLLGVEEMPVSVGLGTFFAGAGAAVGGGMGLMGQFGSLSLGLNAFGPTGAFGGLFGKTKKGIAAISKGAGNKGSRVPSMGEYEGSDDY